MKYPHNLSSSRIERFGPHIPFVPEGHPWPRAYAFPDLTFPLATQDLRGHPPLSAHCHEGFSEIVVVYDGEGVHFTEDSEYAVSSGDVFVVTNEIVHGYQTAHFLHLVNILYDDSCLMNGMSEIRRLPGFHALFHLEPRFRQKHSLQTCLKLPQEKLMILLDMVGQMAQTIREEGPGFQFRSRILLMQIICFLCDNYGGEDTPFQRSIILMDNIIQYVHDHHAEDITLAQLAALAHISERSLLDLFKDATGCSPIEYLIRIRVARACELLRATDLKITDIAGQTGFSDSSYFSKQFHKHMGMLPREYRRQAAISADPVILSTHANRPGNKPSRKPG